MSPATSVIKYNYMTQLLIYSIIHLILILWCVISLRGVFYFPPPSLYSGSACIDKEPRIRDPLLAYPLISVSLWIKTHKNVLIVDIVSLIVPCRLVVRAGRPRLACYCTATTTTAPSLHTPRASQSGCAPPLTWSPPWPPVLPAGGNCSGERW